MIYEREDISVTVFECKEWDLKPSLADFIDWLNDVRKEIPKKYRATAEIEVESVGGYEGEHHAELIISYSRPETDEEMADRVENHKKDIEHQIAWAESRLALLRDRQF